MQEILPGIHRLSLGGVNAYLIDHGGLTLIDTGSPGQGEKILDYVRKLGRQASDIKNILVTHLHPDHTGSLAFVKKETGARVYLHELEATEIEKGVAFREAADLSPGLLNRALYHLLIRSAPRKVDPVITDQILKVGERLPIGEGIQVLATPGHTAGHLSYLYEKGSGFLFAGDAAMSVMGLRLMPFYEDLDAGRNSLRSLGKLEFEFAGFGHGSPLLRSASKKIKKKFG